MADIFEIKRASKNDVPLILSFIKALAEYEKLSHQVTATEEILHNTLFCEKPYAEVVFGYLNHQPVGMALFFHNFSTFNGKPGIYLEDLFVKPEARGKGIGRKMLHFLAEIAKTRNCSRLEWVVLDWNKPAIDFYEKIGAKAMSEWIIYRVTGTALDELAKNN